MLLTSLMKWTILHVRRSRRPPSITRLLADWDKMSSDKPESLMLTYMMAHLGRRGRRAYMCVIASSPPMYRKRLW